MSISRSPLRYKHQLFTSNGTFLVPSNVSLIWIDAIGGGGGGGGGHTSGTTGGGGGGGPSGVWVIQYPFIVSPGESLAVVIGNAGTGGNAGSSGVTGGKTELTGTLAFFSTNISGVGAAGSASNGGASAPLGMGTTGSTTAGAVGTDSALTSFANFPYLPRFTGQNFVAQRRGGGGGGPGYVGGDSTFGLTMTSSHSYLAGGTASGSAGSGMGGGGSGAQSIHGIGGTSGNAGAAGGNASGYGAGGGGGGCNAAGGNGSAGFLRIFWIG